LTRQNAGDLYFLNAFMACTNRPEQPLSSIEFEAGTGDYGENGAVRQTGAATDFKARLSVVQGNRMLNHYLLAGGINPHFEHPRMDGNSRSATTGGRHGFAALIGPEGRLDPTYFALGETNRTLGAVGDLLAGMQEEHDDIALGFLPDYYSTDVKRPGPMMELAQELGDARGPLEGLVRALMACGLSFPAVNLQEAIPAGTRVIALACATRLHSEVQERLVAFVRTGGKLLLYGRIPVKDLQGRAATQLKDALEIELDQVRQGSSSYFPSLIGKGWASGEPEVRVWQLQGFRAAHAEPFLGLLQTDWLAAAFCRLGRGEVAVIGAELPLHLSLWCGVLDRLGVKPKVTHDAAFGGVVLSRVRDDRGQRFVSLINLDAEEKELTIREGGVDLFGGRVFLPGRRAKLLPLGVSVAGLRIERASTEIVDRGARSVSFRQTAMPEWVEVRGSVRVEGDASVESDSSERTVVRIRPGRGKVTVHA
jgi:beta-galactosidase